MSAAIRTPRRKIVENTASKKLEAVVTKRKGDPVTSIRFPERLMLKMKLVADYRGMHYQSYIREVLEREVDSTLHERFSKNLTAVH